jgi:TolA-binding protein
MVNPLDRRKLIDRTPTRVAGAGGIRQPLRARVCAALGAELVGGLASLGGYAPAAAAISEADRLWTIGASAFEDGLYDQAYRVLGRFVEVAPEDQRRGDASVLRGKAALEMGRHDEALAEFQAAETRPTQRIPAGEAIFWQAEILYRLRRFEDARTLYSRFLAVTPGSPYAADALYGMGVSLLESNSPGGAVEAFVRLVDRHPQSKLAPRAAYTASLELVRAKRWDEALAILATYATRFPGSPFVTEVRYLLGLTLVERGRTVGASAAWSSSWPPRPPTTWPSRPGPSWPRPT